MKDLNSKFYKLVRLYIMRKIKRSDFIDMAGWIGFHKEAVHLSCHQLSTKQFNRIVGEVFFDAAQ